MKNKIIEISHINKSLKGMRLIKNINISVEKGKIYGLIGSDNSRKSLLVKILLGLVKPSSGEIKYFGNTIYKSDVSYLVKMGVLLDEIDFYEELSGYENIKIYLKPYLKRLNKISNIDVYERIRLSFDMFNIVSEMNMPVKVYSMGMKQILRLIRVFIVEPEIIILYEPTRYLDPYASKILKDKLKEKTEKNETTVFIATAMIDFIDELADEIGLMHYGEIIDEITKKEILINKKSHLKIVADNISRAILILEKQLDIFDYEVLDDNTLIILSKFDPSYEIIRTLVNENINVKEVTYGSTNFESYFLNRIGD